MKAETAISVFIFGNYFVLYNGIKIVAFCGLFCAFGKSGLTATTGELELLLFLWTVRQFEKPQTVKMQSGVSESDASGNVI